MNFAVSASIASQGISATTVFGHPGKPDVHLERLAAYEGRTTARLCRRLARQTGHRVATIDTILWQACADGILNSRVYTEKSWRAAFNGKPTYIPPEDGEEPIPAT